MQCWDIMAERQIAYLVTPHFGATLACRIEPALVGRPFVLLDNQGRVLAADSLAARSGIVSDMAERQAVARCPAVVCRPAASYPIFETQARLFERLQRYAGCWQPAGLGCAFLDASGLGRNLLGWCQAMAGDVRRLGLAPALGITGSKFGATAAGQAAGEDAALLLNPEVQRAFLATQPVALLPMDADALVQLRHLGIRTLGQFARLPTAGVLTRFGEAGRTAQRWAQGQDDRAVILPREAPEVTARIEFDGPLADGDILLAALARRAEALMGPIRAHLQAIGRLALTITRADARTASADHVFPLPTAAAEPLRLGLAAALGRVTWGGEGVVDVTLTLAGITDPPSKQLSLFDAAPTTRAALTATLDRLATRFGPEAFRMAILTDPDNRLPERRVSWRSFDS